VTRTGRPVAVRPVPAPVTFGVAGATAAVRDLRGNGTPSPTRHDPSAPDPRDRDPSRDAFDDLGDT